MRPRHRLVGAMLFVIAASVGFAPIALADYLQDGHDAARTGSLHGSGPVYDEVAWQVWLPGSRADFAPPLIVDGNVFVVTADRGFGANLSESALWRIDPDSAEVAQVVPFDVVPESAATDGSLLFIAHDDGFAAHRLIDGEQVWSRPVPVDGELDCLPLVVDEGVLFTACTVTDEPVPASAPGDLAVLGYSSPPRIRAFVQAMDVEDGRVHWSWFADAAEAAAAGGQPGDGGSDAQTVSIAYGLSVVGDNVFAVTASGVGSAGVAEFYLWALARDDAALVWQRTSETDTKFADFLVGGTFPNAIGLPTGDREVVFTKIDDRFIALNPAQNRELWGEDIRAADTQAAFDTGSGFAYGDGWVFASSLETVYRFDVAERQLVGTYRTVEAESGDLVVWAPDQPVIGSDRMYVRATDLQTPDEQQALDPQVRRTRDWIHAFDIVDEERLWVHAFVSRHAANISEGGSRLFKTAVDDGVMAVAGLDGSVTLLGRTAASIRPAFDVSTRYPDPGETVTLDGTGSRGGLGGSDFEYRVDWGDGVVTDWRADPVFVHTYLEAADHEALLMVRNDVGQTSVATVLFEVGTPAPTIVSRLFAPERQEFTFFVLGLLVTGAAALFGVLRYRRKVRRFERELRALDDVRPLHDDEPLACEAAFRDRRARFQELLLDGRLSDNHVVLLDKRVDEIVSELRLAAIDDRFDFLPHGMVKRLQGMLADGHVSAWERDVFEATLDKEKGLTKRQKDAVRGLIAKWFDADRRRASVEPNDGSS